MIPAKKQEQPAPSTIEAVLMRGDLSRLTEEQRLEYYNQTCKSLGLNPLTRPFEYLTLNNKLTLYARRDAADQLRKINGISVEIVSQEFAHGLLSIHVRAKDKDGRTDEDLGVVAFPETLKGDVAANAILKAVTKAKRRVTLSLSGLGFLDETEVEDIPASAKQLPPVTAGSPLAMQEQPQFREPESGPYHRPPYPEEIIARQKRDAGRQKQRPITAALVGVPQYDDGSPNWKKFGENFWELAKASEDKAALFALLEANKTQLEEMKEHFPLKHSTLTKQIDELLNEAS